MKNAVTSCYELRIELKCGKNKSVPRTEKMYANAKEVASRFRIRSFFNYGAPDKDGDVFCDGYIYPYSTNVLAVLDALDIANVEYDEIDIPKELDGSVLHKRLLVRFPPRRGINVNPGSIDSRPAMYTKRR